MTDTSDRLRVVRVDVPTFQALAELLHGLASNERLSVPFVVTLSRPLSESERLIASRQGLQPNSDRLEVPLTPGSDPARFHALITKIETDGAALDEHAAGVHAECLMFAEQLIS